MARGTRDSKTKFLDVALHLIRAKGYEATTVDDLCAQAGLTKGSFFHHFDSKEALALAAAAHFAEMAERAFADAPYRKLEDPLDRLLGYVDFRASIIRGSLPDFSCLLGMIVQEAYETHPALSKACGQHIREHARTLEGDIAEAKRRHAPQTPWEPASLALYIQTVIQGAFVMAKAQNSPAAAIDALTHLRRYLEGQFTRSSPKRRSAHA